jgi:hypothetical protein
LLGSFFGLRRYVPQETKLDSRSRNHFSTDLSGNFGGIAGSKESSAANRRYPRNRNLCREALKGRPTMQSSPESASATMPASAADSTQSRRADDLVYQAVTVAAILLLLASLWVF